MYDLMHVFWTLVVSRFLICKAQGLDEEFPRFLQVQKGFNFQLLGIQVLITKHQQICAI